MIRGRLQTLPVVLLPFLALLLVGCPAEGPPRASPIGDLSTFTEGDQFYARVEIEPKLIAATLETVQQGAPALFTYNIRLIREKKWFPDEETVALNLQRRVRFQLILRRFQMREIENDKTLYGDDPEEAGAFLGHLTHIPLAALSDLYPGRYHLEVRFRHEREGISRLYRVLNRLLAFFTPIDHVRTLAFEHS